MPPKSVRNTDARGKFILAMAVTVGVLALQGAFSEHMQLLCRAGARVPGEWRFVEVRTPAELAECDALILPGGESTTMSLVAARSGLLKPLRDFVKLARSLWRARSLLMASAVESIANPPGALAPASFFSPSRPPGPKKAGRT